MASKKPVKDSLILDEDTEPRLYEIAVLYPCPINQKEETEMLKEIDTAFEEAGAKLVEKDVWGKRGLAYPIGGFAQGTYIIYYYEIDPAKIKELDDNLSLVKDLLRHMIVKPPKGYEIVKYSELYKQWEKDGLLVKNLKQRKREDKRKKIEKNVADKAKRKAASRKETTSSTEEVSKEELNEKLGEIISDDDLDL